MNMLVGDNIACKMDGQPILHNISLFIKRGECVGLIGPNGSGKSTLLRTLSGLISPSSGTISVAGKAIQSYKRKELAKLISYVPQNTAIDYDFSVREIVLMGRYPHLSRSYSEASYDREMAKLAMEQTGTLHLADRPATQLSGGQRQLVLIAKALAQEPNCCCLMNQSQHWMSVISCMYWN
ncbi:ABC transporter ATP-binding protein [Paenibacillus sp. JCM 10914]|uniref:ABC transporter ATP-binding protein n=1 Tax=Paenibacillus sp. JCM 10914 TaxID=1236974 RepID=UPI0003CCB29B|nr:ABC transporter ATP-binding protein [Paenibacillus sp. JCM 10914]GAE05179.1 ABC transporter related protein [Paenibacillus sp. JCM 10914]